MLLPYRVKNPVERFPIATVSIIAVNVIVYAFTTQYFLAIRESVVKAYGFSFGSSPILNFISAAFLHAEPFHLIGNMLFLWIFGPPVEDRLRIPRFLLLYLAAGLCGAMLQSGIDVAAIGKAHLSIGASGCIMGVLGAYWYLFSWSPVCIFYWVWWLWYGCTEVAAFWIIGLYFVWDIFHGFFFGLSGMGGVANFAHVGGAIAGALLCLAMRMKRDTEATSQAKAVKADFKDLDLMPLDALRTLVEQEPQNSDLIRAMIKPALGLGDKGAIDEAMTGAGYALIDRDPQLVAYYLTALQGKAGIYQPVHLLRLAGLLERAGDTEPALAIYRLLSEIHPTSPESETALYRMAQCYWNVLGDAQNARTCIEEMAKRFPAGSMTPYGQGLLRQMGS